MSILTEFYKDGTIQGRKEVMSLGLKLSFTLGNFYSPSSV